MLTLPKKIDAPFTLFQAFAFLSHSVLYHLSSFVPYSVIEMPLLRIQESESSDLESVAQYVP